MGRQSIDDERRPQPVQPDARLAHDVGYTQPLLRGFKIDGNSANLQANEMRHSITDLNVQQAILTAGAASTDPLDACFVAIAALGVANKNMEVAQESARQAKAKIAVGQAAQIDAIQTDANVASNEDNVIFAEAAVATAEDNLRSLIFDPSRPDYWTVHITPSDEITVTPRQIDVDAAIRTRWPTGSTCRSRSADADHHAQPEAQHGSREAGGRLQRHARRHRHGRHEVRYGTGYPPPVLAFGPAVHQRARRYVRLCYPNWTLGVQVAYPIGQTGEGRGRAHAGSATTAGDRPAQPRAQVEPKLATCQRWRRT